MGGVKYQFFKFRVGGGGGSENTEIFVQRLSQIVLTEVALPVINVIVVVFNLSYTKNVK